jgi:hypothetical protein
VSNCRVRNDMMNYKTLEGSGHDLVEVLPCNLPGGTEETRKNLS